METKAAVREANVMIICNYMVKINNRLLRLKWCGLPSKIFSIFVFQNITFWQDRHTAIIIWLCQELSKFIKGTILLGCHNMQCHTLKLICILLWLLDPEDEGNTVFWYIRHSSINGTMSHPKRLYLYQHYSEKICPSNSY